MCKLLTSFPNYPLATLFPFPFLPCPHFFPSTTFYSILAQISPLFILCSAILCSIFSIPFPLNLSSFLKSSFSHRLALHISLHFTLLLLPSSIVLWLSCRVFVLSSTRFLSHVYTYAIFIATLFRSPSTLSISLAATLVLHSTVECMYLAYMTRVQLHFCGWRNHSVHRSRKYARDYF